MSGLPSTIREVPCEIQPYGAFREELTVEDGLSLKGTHIVIPHKKHQATLNLIHGHLSLNKCKLKAKDTVYWPGLNEQLGKLVLNCELCLKYTHSNANRNHVHVSDRKFVYIPGLRLPLISFTLKVHPIC